MSRLLSGEPGGILGGTRPCATKANQRGGLNDAAGTTRSQGRMRRRHGEDLTRASADTHAPRPATTAHECSADCSYASHRRTRTRLCILEEKKNNKASRLWPFVRSSLLFPTRMRRHADGRHARRDRRRAGEWERERTCKYTEQVYCSLKICCRASRSSRRIDEQAPALHNNPVVRAVQQTCK